MYDIDQVTGNKVSTPWRPGKRQKQELFAQKVGFWGEGEEEGDGEKSGEGEGGRDRDAAATLNGEVRKGGRGGEEGRGHICTLFFFFSVVVGK